MSTYRGTDGFLALGGAITGTPLVQGAVSQGASSATFDGAAFNGVIRPGDTFTVAGDAQLYTVSTGGVVGATTPNEITVSFTPNVQEVAGWADNAEVSFTSNSVAQLKSWDADVEREFLDETELGSTAEEGTLDVPKWSGRAEAMLDYGDADQKSLVDEAVAGGAATELAIVLGLLPGKQLWGDMLASNLSVTSQRGALVMVAFDFEGTGALAPNWN